MTDDLGFRTCGRTGCRWPAAASLSFRYATGQVWLIDLSPEPDPTLYDLCPHHADTLTVPRGWERVDQRTVTDVVVEPTAAQRAEPRRAAPPARTRRNRYDRLTRRLPELARELAGGSTIALARPPAETGSAPTGRRDDAAGTGLGHDRAAGPQGAARGPALPAPRPHDGSPSGPAAEGVVGDAAPLGARTGAAGRQVGTADDQIGSSPPGEVPGQLVLPFPGPLPTAGGEARAGRVPPDGALARPVVVPLRRVREAEAERGST